MQFFNWDPEAKNRQPGKDMLWNEQSKSVTDFSYVCHLLQLNCVAEHGQFRALDTASQNYWVNTHINITIYACFFIG